MSQTLRGNPEGSTLRGPQGPQPQSGTLRGPQGSQPQSGTLRGPQGSQPQSGTLRGSGMPGGTLRPDGDPLNTQQGKGGTQRGPQHPDGAKKGGTQRGPAQRSADEPVSKRVLKKGLQPSTVTEFTLDGVTYAVDGIISASTGEAEIYKVSKGSNQYALKLYYASIRPNIEVTQILAGAQGTGFLVDVIAHGIYHTPQGEDRHYELQPYYSGGDLQPSQMAGNGQALKMAAVSMLMAVKTAHDHNILHRDIKPGNFLYTDDSRTQMVLCDFGISCAVSRDKKGNMLPVKTPDQFRTKIYAAPETYTVIDGLINYEDFKSDYFSLGVTLLTLWMGEEPFASYDETQLLRLKKRERGPLPMADDLPKELRHLIMGLTEPNPDKRWGFDEFERWLNGENVPVESLHTGDDNPHAQALNILWSGSKNQVAHTFAELVQYMMDDKTLAAQYLYSGKVSQWLAAANYPELALQVDEFVHTTYPRHQEAGVMATAYLLDADLPYVGANGQKMTTHEEIAADMASHPNHYLPMVADTNSPLYVYFRASGTDYAQKFVPVAKGGQRQAFYAMWRMIFTIYPAAPFPIYNPEKPDSYHLVRTVDAMMDYVAQLPNNCYDQCTSAIPGLLQDEAFFLWLRHRNDALAGKVRSKLAQEKPNAHHLYYYIFYLLAPERNFMLENKQDELFTIDHIAQMVNTDYMKYYVLGRHEGNYDKYRDCLERVNQFIKLKENRIYYYLKSKELYKEKFDYIAYCYDYDSKDNRQKAGPYNEEIATFKAINALNDGSCYYFFYKSNKAVSTLDELSEIPLDEQCEELRDGLLKWWLAVQYQENPYADLSEEYAFERLLADYTSHLLDIDVEVEEGQRMGEAYSIVETNAKRCRSLARSVKVWRGVWGLLIALPLLAVATLSIYPGLASYAHPSSFWGYMLVCSSLIIPLRILQAFPLVDEWLLEPLGEDIVKNMYSHTWIVAAVYSWGIGLLLYLLEVYGHSWGGYLLAGIAVAVLAWRYHRCIHKYPLMEKAYDNELHPDDEATIIEPLFYAWKDKGNDNEFVSETIDEQEKFIEGTKYERLQLIKRTAWSLIPTIMVVAFYLLHSTYTEQYIKEHDPQRWEKVYGEGKDIPKVENMYYADVQSSLTVRAKASAKAKKLGAFGPGEQFEVLEVTDGFAKIKYGDGFGYVNEKYIKPVADEEAKAAEATKAAEAAPAKKEKAKAKAQAEPKATAATANTYTLKSGIPWVNFYSAPEADEDSKKGQIPAGDTFEVLSDNGTWATVRYAGATFYVESQYIQQK